MDLKLFQSALPGLVEESTVRFMRETLEAHLPPPPASLCDNEQSTFTDAVKCLWR